MRPFFETLRQAGAFLCLCLLLCAPPADAQSSEQETFAEANRLMQAQSHGDALPLLEALVSAKPRNKHYRFNLALALFALERDGRARYHLEQVRGAGLNANERQLVDTVVGKIDERRVWSGYLGFNLRPESNGTKQTADRQVTVGGVPFTLNDTAIGKPTVSGIVNTGFSYTPRLSETLKLELSLGAILKHNSDRALRDHQVTARAGVQYFPDTTKFWSAGALIGKRWSAGTPYSETLGLYANHARRVGQVGTLSLGAEFSRAFRTQGRADIDRSFLILGYRHAIGGNAQLSFNAFVERNNTDQANLDGFRRGAQVSAAYAFEGGLITSLTLRAELDDRNGISPLFGVQRSDRKVAADLRIHHRDFRIGSFAPEIQLGIERNRSNIPLADYTNRYISLGLTRKF